MLAQAVVRAGGPQLLKSGLHKRLSKDNCSERSFCVQDPEGGMCPGRPVYVTDSWFLLCAVTQKAHGKFECLQVFCAFAQHPGAILPEPE